MDTRTHASLFLTLVWLTTAFLGCMKIQPEEQPPSTVVQISDVKTVAGKWEGMLKETPSPPPLRYGGDWVTLTIHENGEFGNGTFEFAGYRTIGVFMGSGSLMLENGKLKSESEKGHATYTLYDRNGKPILAVEARDKKGIRYHAELTRAK
jgi:hypothetical protein